MMHDLFQWFKKKFQSMIWSLNGRCDECGGNITAWSTNKAYCDDCGARN